MGGWGSGSGYVNLWEGGGAVMVNDSRYLNRYVGNL